MKIHKTSLAVINTFESPFSNHSASNERTQQQGRKAMRNRVLFIALFFIMGALHAQEQCETVLRTDLRLLPKTTFNVNFQQPLNGCFTGYLPENENFEDGLYRFGIFRDSKLITPLPVVEAGADLSSHPLDDLKILAVSFDDLDRDGRHDVTVLGQRSGAKSDRIFMQVFWGCPENFVYDNKVNSDVDWDVGNLSKINIKAIKNYIRKKGFKAKCGGENP
ncbi:hypothetical protein [Pseudomonas sp. RIT-PI-S]|uniref:hypothetical protein n=1 Tax=Pseudomonas sp. RIT-PI-S TaxID=3035295 RepID=UPI0021D7FE7E|nr:hypothetical protein [Pseudomonas sp. RIT-PI-S]